MNISSLTKFSEERLERMSARNRFFRNIKAEKSESEPTTEKT